MDKKEKGNAREPKMKKNHEIICVIKSNFYRFYFMSTLPKTIRGGHST